MKLNHCKYFLLCIALLFSGFSIAQSADSTSTAFRKGRWLTGLSGSISSTTTELKSANLETTSNNFGINIESGKFIKNRLLLGGLFQANKISTAGNIEKTTETLYIGPFSNYYFMNEKIGSLYAKLSIGYARYKDETEITLQDDIIQEFSEGDGFGSILGLGYQYTINDFVAFDLGVNLSLFWVSVEQESFPDQTITNSNFNSSDIALKFGFNVILDKFFF